MVSCAGRYRIRGGRKRWKVKSGKWEGRREKGEGRREPLSKGENEYVVK
jgi:hypothetical protein